MASGGYFSSLSPLPCARSDHTATAVGDVLYLFGGCDGAQDCGEVLCKCSSITSDAVAYSPATDSYKPLLPMPVARYRHIACAVGNVIYVFGGRELASDNILTTTDAFDTVRETWTTLPPAGDYPSGLGSDNSCTTVGDSVYVMGGYPQFYEPAFTSTFAFTPSALAPAPLWVEKRGTMNTPRGDFASVGTADGRVFVYGGYSTAAGSSWFCTPLSSVEVYNPATDEWTNSPATMLVPAAEKDDGLLLNGRVYAFGGETKEVAVGCTDTDIMPLSGVYSVDPSAPGGGTWRSEATLPTPIMRFAATELDGAVYIFGGQGAEVASGSLPIKYTAYKFTPGAPPSASPSPLPPSAPPAASSLPAASSSPLPPPGVSYAPGVLGGAIIGTFLLTLVALVVLLVCRSRRRSAAKKGLTSGTELEGGLRLAVPPSASV